MPSPRTARERAREQITAEILAAARERLTRGGPSELSLRAVARDVGMVSSAVYRYFPSRDDLLTALLVLAYDEVGAAAEQADAAVADRDDVSGRWWAACRAVRHWAATHPGDYALLYGSPVPGYQAPADTIAPATRVVLVLIGITLDAQRLGAQPRPTPPGSSGQLVETVGDALAFLDARGLETPPEVAVRLLMAWTTLFGTISFELFGHLVGSVSEPRDYFDEVVARLATDLGITMTPAP